MKPSIRTNFVMVENLPAFLSDGQLLDHFSSCGEVQDLTKVSPTSFIVTYEERELAENAVFTLNNSSLSDNTIQVRLYFPSADPQVSNSRLQFLNLFL